MTSRTSIRCSSHVAWEVARITGFSANLQVRFEARTVAPEPRGVIQTDMIFWTDPAFRIAVELKAPVRSEDGSNSAMTHGRMAFYKDIDRLCYLVERAASQVRRGIIFVHESARAFAPAGSGPLHSIWWKWANNANQPVWDALRPNLQQYFQWYAERSAPLGYPADRIKAHQEMAQQYFAL